MHDPRPLKHQCVELVHCSCHPRLFHWSCATFLSDYLRIFFAMNSFIDPAIRFFPVIWNFFVSSFRRQFGGDTLDWLVVTFLSPRRRHWVHDGVKPFFSRPCCACAVCFLLCLVYLNVCLHLFSYTRVKNKMVEQTCRALVHSSISS